MIDEIARRMDRAQRNFGRYARDVIEWAAYMPDFPPPDPHDYFACPLSCNGCERCRVSHVLSANPA